MTQDDLRKNLEADGAALNSAREHLRTMLRESLAGEAPGTLEVARALVAVEDAQKLVRLAYASHGVRPT